jgi:uncharacterized protein
VRKFVCLLTILLSALAAFTQSAYTVETVPNTKLINNSYVSNPDGLLSAGAVSQINILLDSLEKKTTAQVAVVMLNSIGEADIFEFAQSLFVKWGLGKSSRDNGLLILYVQDKRTVRFHTGYGLEGILPDAICKRIQMQKMVPRFKEGQTDGGMIAGIEEVARIISNPNSSEDIGGNENTIDNMAEEGGFSFLTALAWLFIGPFYFFSNRKSGFANSKNFYHPGPNTTMKKGNWWLWYFILPIILLITLTFVENRWIFYGIIYGYLMLLAVGKYNRMISSANAWLKKGEYQTVYEFYQNNKAAMGLAFLFPIPFVFLIGNFKKRKMAARHYPRPCNKCKQLISAPLTEAAEDEFLSPETIFEENLKSVDYDVWKCNHCGDFHYEMYINPKTKFTQCPKCNTYALYTASSSTKVEATTSFSGIREVIMQCKYCNKQTVVEETIPVISTSSDSSGSSSSSDSGGSWGGGDSGGGGASSRW